MKFSLKNMDDILPGQLSSALVEIERLKEDLSAYFGFRAELRDFLCREVIGAGTPWDAKYHHAVSVGLWNLQRGHWREY